MQKKRREHPPEDERNYLTLRETAAKIGVAASTLRSWVRSDIRNSRKPGYERRAPKFYRAGRLMLFLKVEVKAWIEKHTF